MPLISVDQDPETHGSGALIATQHTVFANNKPIIILNDPALADSLCPTAGGAHCAPQASQGSPTVYIANQQVHRQDDSRSCGATTIVVGQTTVYADS